MPDLSRWIERLEKRLASFPGIERIDPEAVRARQVAGVQATYANMTDEQRRVGAEAFARRFGSMERFRDERKSARNGGDNFKNHSWQPPKMSIMSCAVAFAAREINE
jgi:hypothetical protein